MESNFSDHKVPHFYMPSGLCYERMSFTDKTIMKMLSKIQSAKANKTDVEHGTATAITKSYDISDKRFIKPLIEYVKNEYFKSSS